MTIASRSRNGQCTRRTAQLPRPTPNWLRSISEIGSSAAITKPSALIARRSTRRACSYDFETANSSTLRSTVFHREEPLHFFGLLRRKRRDLNSLEPLSWFRSRSHGTAGPLRRKPALGLAGLSRTEPRLERHSSGLPCDARPCTRLPATPDRGRRALSTRSARMFLRNTRPRIRRDLLEQPGNAPSAERLVLRWQ